MKVVVYDVDKPERAVDENYPIDAVYGAPVPGDEILLREREYQTNFWLTGTVRRRRWVITQGKPEFAELHLWISRTK
jgi:hypothetical protein